MNHRASQVGFSQRVRLEWLDRAANMVLAGNDAATVNSALQEFLKDKVSVGGEAQRGNREKIITVVMKVWINVPPEFLALRNDGLELLKRMRQEDRIAVHWGMVLAVYPFWGAVASQVGRLLKLQSTAAAAQIQRRIREQYGERVTVSRAARRVIRSIVDWGVLEETGTKGVYRQGLSRPVNDPKLVAWLVEACLYARSNGSANIRDLIESPSLFPFSLVPVSAEDLAGLSARLDILRHGLDENLVMLRKQRDASPR